MDPEPSSSKARFTKFLLDPNGKKYMSEDKPEHVNSNLKVSKLVPVFASLRDDLR